MTGRPSVERDRALALLAPFGVDDAAYTARERRMSTRAGRPVTPDEVFWSLATERAVRLAAAGHWYDASELHMRMARRQHEQGGDPGPLRREAERFRVRHIVASAGDRPVELEISACDCAVCAPADGRRVTVGEVLAGDLGIPHGGCDRCSCTVQGRGDPDDLVGLADDPLSSLLRRVTRDRGPAGAA